MARLGIASSLFIFCPTGFFAWTEMEHPLQATGR